MARALACAACPVLAVAMAVPAVVEAGVKTEQRIQVQFTGLIGGLMSHFGGKAAKEGLVSTVAVVGDRRLTLNDETGEIVDLAEEKLYELNAKDRTYQVVTFAEIRKRLEEQRAKAQKEAEKARREQAKKQKQEPPPEGEAPQFDVDVRVSRTGEKKAIAGHEAAQVIARVSVYPKGSSLQQSGGMALVSDQWLAPDVPELKELADFERRYAQKMADAFGFDAGSVRASAEQMASLAASHPGLVQALERLKAERAKFEGTPLLSITTLNLIRSAEQVAKAEKDDTTPLSVGGFFAKKLMKKAAGDPTDVRQALMTSTIETLKVTTEATAADVALPAGYKPKN